MNIIKAGFIGNFKLGDNINYNLGILQALYDKDKEENICSLNKPITIIVISIIEALLYDFHFKAKWYTCEGITNVTDKVLFYIRNKKINRFNKYIKSARKHKIFNENDQLIYDDLETLRKLRNRIHIQNENNDFARDEADAFSIDRKILAEKTLEKIMKHMSENHDREFKNVDDFILPWSAHDV